MTVTRKDIFSRAIAVALLIVFASAGGPAFQAACTAHAQVPSDVLVVGQTAEPNTLDPHQATSLNDFRIISQIFEGLVRFREGTLDIEPGLAEAWTISDDGLEYTFKLRRGIRFHDGTRFDAAAVRFSFGRLADPDHAFHDTGPFPLAFLFEMVESVDALDAYTVRFRLKEPFAPFLSNLAYPTGFVVSPKAIRDHGRNHGRFPTGTGPFRFELWESGIRVILKRNPDYRDGSPALEAIAFRPLVDPNTRVTELLAGGIDVMIEIPAELIAILRARDDLDVHEVVGPHLWFLILNTRHGPFRDPRMRRAVNYAIDKKALVERILQGTATAAAGPVPKAFEWAHNDAVEPYPHDPDRARALIRDAGYTGESLVLYASEGGSGMLEPRTMAVAIQADLRDVGLNVSIETFEWNTYLSKVNAGLDPAVDMAEMAWMTNDPDTLPYLALRSDAVPEKGGFNSGYYQNEEVDALIEEARRTGDRDRRAELYARMQRIVHEEAPWVFVASWKQNAVAREEVQGLRLEPSFLLDLKGVSKSS